VVYRGNTLPTLKLIFLKFVILSLGHVIKMECSDLI
jgi:hypothetical protein